MGGKKKDKNLLKLKLSMNFLPCRIVVASMHCYATMVYSLQSTWLWYGHKPHPYDIYVILVWVVCASFILCILFVIFFRHGLCLVEIFTLFRLFHRSNALCIIILHNWLWGTCKSLLKSVIILLVFNHVMSSSHKS